MKTATLFAAAVLWAAGARAAGPASGQVEVNFDHPEKFADIKDTLNPTDKGEAAILDTIKTFVTDQAAKLLPAGDKLAITFTDIDLAGDFEPWRGPMWDQTRVVKDIYPPRFKFAWTLTDSSGAVVKQGKADIVDLDFQMQMDPYLGDALHYEKEALRSWMSQNLRGVKK